MKLGLIGAGNMASALARGIGEPVLVADVDGAKARALARELGGEAVASNAELAERADVVVLCHKPAQLEEVAAQWRRARRGRLDPGGDQHGAARGRLPGACPSTASSPTSRPRCATACSATSPGRLAADGPEAEIARAVRPRRHDRRARPRAADRARHGADELRSGLHGAGRGVVRGRRRRPRARPRRGAAHDRRDDGRHGRVPARARLRHRGAEGACRDPRAAPPSAA